MVMVVSFLVIASISINFCTELHSRLVKMGILEKIGEIEREIARTQKNKGNQDRLYSVISKIMHSSN